MNAENKGSGAGKPSMYSAYCAFKDDRYRLGALVSHDLSKVAIVGLIVLGLYIAPSKAVTAMLGIALRLFSS